MLAVRSRVIRLSSPSGVSKRPAMILKLCTRPMFMLSFAILDTDLMIAVGPL